jgi:excisionase family DNA binding protein
LGDLLSITPRWLKLRHAQAYSGLGRDTLRALADSGLIHAGHTPGGHRLFDRESIDAYLGDQGQEEKARAILKSLGR